MSCALFVDPPSGWKYGFPKRYTPGKDDLKKMLEEAGYPEEDIPFALEHSRYISTNE